MGAQVTFTPRVLRDAQVSSVRTPCLSCWERSVCGSDRLRESCEPASGESHNQDQFERCFTPNTSSSATNPRRGPAKRAKSMTAPEGGRGNPQIPKETV